MSSRKSEIDLRLWQVIASIPTGKVASYGDIARHAGLPGAARRVGYALRHLPQDTKIPWHRVVNAQGRISLPAGSVGQYTQRERLEAEGMLFQGNKIAHFGEFRWRPGDL
jgi:methylated-DNA-protein-cysteine methyltransferase-like protein